jgi:hypothetical protein
MPYVNVPNDLSKIKTKMAFNLTKRQLLCFGSAAALGVPAYLLARDALGNSAAMLGMIALMLPFFFAAMYERDGLPFEKVARNIILARFIRPGPRPYKTENFYAALSKSSIWLTTPMQSLPAQTSQRRSLSGLQATAKFLSEENLNDETKTTAAKRQAEKRRSALGPTDHTLPRNTTGRRMRLVERAVYKND